MKPIVSEGAEARIYRTELYGRRILVKRREPKRYRIKELDSSIREYRTRREATALARARSSGASVPRLVGVGRYDLYIEEIKGKTLSSALGIGSGAAREAGVQLAILHNAGIAHGDFTPANLILSGKRVYVIDFGLSSLTTGSEERALDLLLMKRQLSRAEYSSFIRAYRGNAAEGNETLARLREVEERGRYQKRTLSNI